MKGIITLILSILLIFSFTSCNGNGDNGGGDGDGNFDSLQTMLDAPCKSCNITVSTKISESESLTSIYDIVQNSNGTVSVNLKLQQLSGFKLENGVYKKEKKDFITELTAFYLFEDGELIRSSGNRTEIKKPTGEFPRFNLCDDYFENASDSGVCFTAGIKDIKGFAGWDTSCNDATLNISYNNGGIVLICISFTDSAGYQTEVRYTYNRQL